MSRLQHHDLPPSTSVTFRRVRILLGSFVVLTLAWAPGQAADELVLEPEIIVVTEPLDPIVGIRTDWEIQFSKLNRKTTTPQIIAVLSPDGTVNGDYMILELNHSSLPSYSKGGLQIQIWNYDQEQTWSDVYFAGTECQTDTERIRFTMEMKLVDDVNSQTGKRLWFRVLGFKSDTWGKIDTFREFGIATQLTSLNAFSANQCITESGINAGASQVDYMKIDRVDYLYKSGSTDGDSTDVSVYSTQVKVDTTLDTFTLDKALAY
jgi:hypothetical protein